MFIQGPHIKKEMEEEEIEKTDKVEENASLVCI